MKAIAIVVACAACGKSQTAPTAGSGAATASGSASSATTASSLVAKIDGKPLAAEHALVKRLPDGRLQLYVGQGGTCEQLRSNMFDGRDPHMLIDLRTLLLSDGGTAYGIGDVYAGGPPVKADPHDKAGVRGDVKGPRVAIDLEFTARDARLVVKGTVDAEQCGEQDAPPSDGADRATMTIAGTAFPIRAGLLRGDDLELVDLPRDCTSATYIGMRLRRERGTWHLDGSRMPVEVTGPAPKLQAAPGPVRAHPEAGHVMLTLSGSDQIGAYAVAMQGMVDVVDCNYAPPKK